MNTIGYLELQDILKRHVKWLSNEDGGERANLSYIDLRYAKLQGVDLRYAILRYIDLRYANLQGADLRFADLRYGKLQYTNLQGADLRQAKTRGINIDGADIDFSRWTQWCGKVKKETAIQIAHFFCELASDDVDIKKMQKSLIKQINKQEQCRTSEAQLII